MHCVQASNDRMAKLDELTGALTQNLEGEIRAHVATEAKRQGSNAKTAAESKCNGDAAKKLASLQRQKVCAMSAPSHLPLCIH